MKILFEFITLLAVAILCALGVMFLRDEVGHATAIFICIVAGVCIGYLFARDK